MDCGATFSNSVTIEPACSFALEASSADVAGGFADLRRDGLGELGHGILEARDVAAQAAQVVGELVAAGGRGCAI